MKRFLSLAILSLLPFSASYAATPEQCYSYLTELVRSSNFPFSAWAVKPQQVNLLIDEDNESMTRAKLMIDTDGTGTIGWVIFDKTRNQLFNTTTDPETPVKLKFNKEYQKAQQYCLVGAVIYQVASSGRLYLFDKTNASFQKTDVFIVKGDYVKRLAVDNQYSHITYQAASGNIVSGWVDSAALRKIDFKNSW